MQQELHLYQVSPGIRKANNPNFGTQRWKNRVEPEQTFLEWMF